MLSANDMKSSSTLCRQLVIVLFITISMVGFVGYYYALLDCIQDHRNGVYVLNVWEGFYETGALIVYTLGAIHFMNRHINK